jgi:hypothetical protein
MALYSSPVLRKKQPLQPMQRDQMPALDPTGGTAPKPMAFAGQPQALGGAMPRQPGNVVPKPPASRVGMGPAAPGMGGPRQPSPPQQPRPNPLPPPSPAPAQGMTETPSEPATTTTDDVDQMIRDFLSGQLRNAGQANTAEEEALIQQQIERSMGQGLVNQRARAGRAGMGMSGALMAQEGDIRRAASMDALDQILGLRRSEEQRGIENAMGAISAETGMRSAAANDALRRMALEALQAEMGLDAEVGAGDAGVGFVGGESGAPVWNPITEQDSETPQRGVGSDVDPKIVDALPAGAVPYAGRPGLFIGEDGYFYRLRG